MREIPPPSPLSWLDGGFLSPSLPIRLLKVTNSTDNKCVGNNRIFFINKMEGERRGKSKQLFHSKYRRGRFFEQGGR